MPEVANDGTPAVGVRGDLRQTWSTAADLRTTRVTGGGGAELDSGVYVLIVSEPVAADGTWWLMVTAEQDPRSSYETPLVGWIPVGTRSDPTLVEDYGACLGAGVDVLSRLSVALRIGCFGSEPVACKAHQAAQPAGDGLGGACGAPPGRPEWLLCDSINYSWVKADGGTDWTFLLHFDPKGGVPELDLAPAGTVGPAYWITAISATPRPRSARHATPSRAIVSSFAMGPVRGPVRRGVAPARRLTTSAISRHVVAETSCPDLRSLWLWTPAWHPSIRSIDVPGGETILVPHFQHRAAASQRRVVPHVTSA